MRDYQSDKSTKAEANYRKGSGVKMCQNCTMHEPPDSCSAVEGYISPEGVCDYFKMMKGK